MDLILRNRNSRIVVACGFLFLFCFAGIAEAGQWCASVSGYVSGHECFDSEQACKDAVAKAKREQGDGSAFRYTACAEEGGDTSSSASSGDPADDLIAKGSSNVVSGVMNGSPDTFAVGAMGILGGALIKGMQGDPAADARRAQEAAAAAEQQRQYELQQAREEEARKQRLLGEMMDVDAPSEPASEAENSNNDDGLGLMLDDESPSSSNSNGSAFMANHKARPKINPQPVAVRKQPEPAALSLSDQMMTDETPVKKQPAAQEPDPQLDDAAWQKGNSDGSQCFSASAGNHCAGAQGAIFQSCIANYESGYRNGESLKRILLANARNAGILDKQQGQKNSSFTHPDAQGPCRVQWIESYNEGYAGAPASPVGR